jgi:hypothetical protein
MPSACPCCILPTSMIFTNPFRSRILLVLVMVERSWSKPFPSEYENESYITVVFGFGLFRTLGAQWGFMRDPSSAELQGKLGLSLTLFNHLRITMDQLTATGGSELYDRQRGFSISLFNLQKWGRSDRSWWRLVDAEIP